MDAYDVLVLLGVSAISFTTSFFVFSYKAGLIFGGIGFFLIVVQLVYAVAVSPLHFPLSIESFSGLTLSPARLGVALGLFIATPLHILKMLATKKGMRTS